MGSHFSFRDMYLVIISILKRIIQGGPTRINTYNEICSIHYNAFYYIIMQYSSTKITHFYMIVIYQSCANINTYTRKYALVVSIHLQLYLKVIHHNRQLTAFIRKIVSILISI